jgi:hypothetical protein
MVNMTEYIKNIIFDFPEVIIGMKASPASNHLYKAWDLTLFKLLLKEQAREFHHAVAQLLFLSSRAPRVIQLAVAFLTARVKVFDEDDWGKVKRVLGYLKGMLHMPQILSVDSLTFVQWGVDAVYAVHHDCKSHTGAGMSSSIGKSIQRA